MSILAEAASPKHLDRPLRKFTLHARSSYLIRMYRSLTQAKENRPSRGRRSLEDISLHYGLLGRRFCNTLGPSLTPTNSHYHIL